MTHTSGLPLYISIHILTRRTVYFFLRHSPIQFQITAIMTLCWDAAVFAQRLKYGTEPPRGMINEERDRQDARGLRVGQGGD